MTTTLLYLSWTGRGALAMVFAASVLAKTHRVAAFTRFRQATATLTGQSGRRAGVLAVLTVAAETAVAAGSVVARTAPWAAAGAIGLLALFTWRLGAMPDTAFACGCFGTAAIGRRAALIRNGLLLAIAAIALAGTLGGGPAGRSTGPAGPLVCAAAAALLTTLVVRIGDVTAVFPARR
ncbi:hypothetical protein ACWT_0886 [Actinoplanes sp. SE50]|uniref:MauE/DoxX family redox-associated membrane protein n=1 Tax=unclassified Actinoplanes TaxID=2626549 RepID=UPI00023EC3D7|nr:MULTISPECIES: MauE/DoxX family redox-associated membrane protein [unclassified Actinoplanes]AEV81900.1 hypothetical protein ACPL_1003 [Actinoplanes sp. SE50/110]ATO80301.1 hypothetical protein ACWT_0886 [Actinoplanes sp. SE50]SLL97706.1 uncharacterized protein ACSP50_0915 [Actinoplanes sp. SE50/110]